MSSSYAARTLKDVHDPGFVSFLNLARWSAASIVFLGHLRDPLFIGYLSIPAADRTLAVKLWYFATGWHGAAVIIFFVLSGYLVGGVGCAKVSVVRFSALEYAIDRVTRLFVAYWPALLLTALLDVIGMKFLSNVGFWDHTQAMLVEKIHAAAFQKYFTWQLFVANAAMLQTFVTDSFGSNQPLWTISAEFWFYVVFGVFLAAGNTSARMVRIGLCTIAIIAAIMLGPNFIPLFGLWLVGVAAAFPSHATFERPRLACLVFVAVLVVTRKYESWFSAGAGLQARNFAVALSFAWLLLSMRTNRFHWLKRAARANAFMADFSYSLYLIHFPLMLFVMGVLYATGAFSAMKTGYSPVDPIGLSVYAIVIVAAYVCAYLFSLMTERQTSLLRGLLKVHLSIAKPASAK